MRIAIALGHAVLAACVLSSCSGGNSTGASTSNSTTPGSLLENPPARLASLTAADFAAQLSLTSSGQALLAIASGGTGTLACGVDFHLYHYATTGGAGESATASGALMVPTGPNCTGARGIILHAHGTAMTSGFNMANIADSTNEAYDESAMVAAMYAAHGFIVVAPNYTGYKDSNLSYHPYLNGAQNSAEMIDALAAARSAISGGMLFSPVSDSGKLFLTGYSEGGYVSMATHKALQAAGKAVTGAVHMSGPYALEAMGDAILLGNVNIGSTVFVPLALTSYQKAYKDIYTATTDVYESAYATGIETLLPTATSYAALTAGPPGSNLLFSSGKLPQLALFNSTTPTAADFNAIGVPSPTADAFAAQLVIPSNPLAALGFGTSNLLKNSVRMQYAIDALSNMDGAIAGAPGVPLAATTTYPLRTHFKANDMRTWTPGVSDRILLCGGHDDPTVFYSVNTKTMLAYWPAPLISTPSTPSVVTEVDVDPGQALASGGIATQVGAAVAATYFADETAGATAAKMSADVQATVIGMFPSHFLITATSAVPIDPQGILVAGVSQVAAQVAAGDLAAGVANPATVGSDVGTAVVAFYHGTLVQPACTAAAASFFASL